MLSYRRGGEFARTSLVHSAWHCTPTRCLLMSSPFLPQVLPGVPPQSQSGARFHSYHVQLYKPKTADACRVLADVSIEATTGSRCLQDAVCVYRRFGGDPEQVFFGVFDGHGQTGTSCAQFAKDKVLQHHLVQQAFSNCSCFACLPLMHLT